MDHLVDKSFPLCIRCSLRLVMRKQNFDHHRAAEVAEISQRRNSDTIPPGANQLAQPRTATKPMSLEDPGLPDKTAKDQHLTGAKYKENKRQASELI
jgi:hypothetical protein